MANLQRNAEELASKGRYGDNKLLHVSDVELAGLASLIPGGQLPRNPDTGLPEAFFFLPFLMGAAPAAAGATAAAAPALAAGTAAGAGALGAGLTAGMEAATMGGLAGATTAAAAPTIAGTGAMGLGAVTPTLAEAGLAASPAVAGAAPTIAGTGALGTGAVTPALAEAGLSATAPMAAGGGAAVAEGAGLGGLLGGSNLSTSLMSMAPLAMMMGQGGGGGGGDEEPDISGVRYKGGEPKFPGKGYRGGIDPEFRYFEPVSYLRDGGLVKRRGYADGGLAAIDQGGMGQMPAAQAMPEGGVKETSREDAMLIEAAVAAIQGQVPNADAVLKQFLARFGEQALQDLVMRVQQIPQQGGGQPSDGRSDSIPANLSEGEYVVPSDVVSGMGRGSTEAGARQLDQMSTQVRNMNQGGLMY